jgi:iron complex transport system substrate-binding protein
MTRIFLFFCTLLLSITYTNKVNAAITVLDDAQRKVTLEKPAKRIISLAPHTTELIFAAGAGHLLVGVSEYSDYPEEAKKITSIGSIFALDLERILALKPDLIVIWGTGNAKQLAKKLRDNHLNVFESEPTSFEMIATSIENLATLSGTENQGKLVADRFRHRLSILKQTYALKINQQTSSVFFQIARSPLMTINKNHIISSIIKLCGGKNIFNDLHDLSSTITVESVISANPDIIITSEQGGQVSFDTWRKIPQLNAVKLNNLLTVNGNHIYRAGPRILDATEEMCQKMGGARMRQ